MLDVFFNFVKNPNPSQYDWFAERFRSRLPLLAFLLAFQMLYFPINQIHEGGFTADIEAIDSNMPLLPIFVVPYTLSVMLMPLFPLYAAWRFPRPLFREYMVAFFTIMVMGYSLWILIPAYVEKQPITQTGFFVDLLKMLHNGDEGYGVHNALPSSHVYYITLGICYLIRSNPKLLISGILFAVINALSTMFTHQHYFLDVLAGIVLTWVAYTLAHHVLVPKFYKLDLPVVRSSAA